MLRLLLACACACLALACTSSSSGGRPVKTGIPARVTYRDYRTGQLLELVNESHTDRIEQYSQLRENANRKVQSDEIVGALIDHLRGSSSEHLWLTGAAPERARGDWLWSLEIEDAGGLRHMAMPPGLPSDKKGVYRELWQAFLDTYNLTYSLQAVKVDEGSTPFSAPATDKPPGR